MAPPSFRVLRDMSVISILRNGTHMGEASPKAWQRDGLHSPKETKPDSHAAVSLCQSSNLSHNIKWEEWSLSLQHYLNSPQDWTPETLSRIIK
jgi:hypothetical protein